MSILFDPTMNYLSHGLNASLRRQVLLQGNIANLDTPGFTPHDVDFDAAMRNAAQAQGIRLDRTSESHLKGRQLEPIQNDVYERADTEPGLDGNSVDLDMQMARLSQNAILYKASTKLMTKKLALLKYAVSEGVG